MTEELARAVAPFCSGKGSDEPVVCVGEGDIYRIINKYGSLVGKPEIKPHDLRHAFVTGLLEHGVNIRVVQELMGHKPIP
jgi:site-specific recombinase XerD